MYQLSKLINNLETELQKTVNKESISLRISNNQKFDFQINNLKILMGPNRDLIKDFSVILN